MRYLLLICLKEEKSGAGKFANNNIPHLLPTALPVGVFLIMPSLDGIMTLTCTIFDPSIFLRYSVSIFAHISPTRLKSSIMGNYLDFALKIAHRGNTR